jgi:hypothetical protein
MERRGDLRLMSYLHRHPLDDQQDSLLHHELLAYDLSSDFFQLYRWWISGERNYQQSQLLHGMIL